MFPSECSPGDTAAGTWESACPLGEVTTAGGQLQGADRGPLRLHNLSPLQGSHGALARARPVWCSPRPQEKAEAAVEVVRSRG